MKIKLPFPYFCMIEPNEYILNKWKELIEATRKYYISSEETGWSDYYYDSQEKRAKEEDGFYVRDYVLQKYLIGKRTPNKYIEKIKKTKAGDSMYNSLKIYIEKLGSLDDYYVTCKYDGSSIAIYLDPQTGTPKSIVTVGNTNIDSSGIDQTWKLLNFLPRKFPLGIVAIQCEALIDTSRYSESERARQKANALINGKLEECMNDVKKLLTLRAYRYYTDDSPQGIAISGLDYKDVLESFETIYSPEADHHVLFAPADIWKFKDLSEELCAPDKIKTSTGEFLRDGLVIYNKNGVCQGALKYSGAGTGTEGVTKTKVLSIQWNDQSQKGKDSWSANVIVEPIVVKGSTIKKPSAGSVSKLVKNNITPGAEISVILANSTIPMVSEVFKPGNGDFMWPKCTCGYEMSEKDVYGSNLKCGNQECTVRLKRMRSYVNSLKAIMDLDLNKLLVIDRFKWEDTNLDLETLLGYVEKDNPQEYYNYLKSYLKTELQIRNLDLVWKASWFVLREVYVSKK